MSEVVATAQQGLAGKYPPYPEYKDSGVEWLQLCPSSWETKALKYIVSCNDEVLSESTDPDMEFEYIDIGGVSSSEGITRTESMRFSGAPSRARRIVRQGDIIVSTVRTYLEAIAPISLEFDGKIASTGFAVLRPKYLLSGFAKYALRARHFIDSVVARSTGVSYPAINSSELIDIKIVVPSLKEQQTIASFLDYETARIDRLIAQQQRLIELLKEKRQAVISHAVTKGLNPNAPMKNSGVEWLGQVPEHWIVRRLKHHIISMDQGWSPQCEARLAEENEFGVMKVGCVNGGVFRFSEHKALPAELEPKTEYRLKKGQLLVSRANTRELVGSAAVVDADYDQLLLCDKLYRIKLSSDVSPEFVALLLGTSAYRGQIELSASGASDSMQNIGQSTIKELPIAVPPMDEANDILKYVATRLYTFDCLNNQLQQQNLLLQERRTALISAAVTGKIDLRGWTQPAEEVAA